MGGPGSGRKKGSGSKTTYTKLGNTNPLGKFSKVKPNPYVVARNKANISAVARQTGLKSNGVKVIKNNGFNSKAYSSYKSYRKSEGGKGRFDKRVLALTSKIRTGTNK
jgi:copper oxidase (laccase) domain-containing protein